MKFSPNNHTQIIGFHSDLNPFSSFFHRSEENNNTNTPTEIIPLNEYTNEQQLQIRQSLTGRYRRDTQDELNTRRLEIRPNNITSVTDNQQISFSYLYDISFFPNTEPILTFRNNEDRLYTQFYIQLNQKYQVTGLHTVLMDPVRKFKKEEDLETLNPHQEL